MGAPGSSAYAGSRPARPPTLTSAPPRPQQTCRLPSSHHCAPQRARRAFQSITPLPRASGLLSCSHTFFKGEKSPSDTEFLFGRVSPQFFTQTLLPWNTKLKLNKNTQYPSRKKSFQNPGFYSSLIITKAL